MDPYERAADAIFNADFLLSAVFVFQDVVYAALTVVVRF
jgi:hypothetical protein